MNLPKNKLPTIRDVAALARVSIATVSHVVNNTRPVAPETRQRVEAAIAQSGFRPNPAGQSLANRKSGLRAARTGKDATAKSIDALDEETRIDELSSATTAVRVSAIEAQSNSASSTGTATRALLRIIRAAQPISRVELAHRLSVSRSAITEAVKPLLANGVLRETTTAPDDDATNNIGRLRVGLAFDTSDKVFIGVNIGVRRTQVGAATIETADDNLIVEDSFDTPESATEALQLIAASIEWMQAQLAGRRVVNIGVSVPGPVDTERTRLLYAPHLGMDGWRDTPIAELLRVEREEKEDGQVGTGDANNVPVIVENDATAAAVYELRRRIRQVADNETADEWRDFILVRAGTGIGVGLVLNGEVYRGTGAAGGAAGEFGHMTIVAGGKLCACGNRGCWECYASATSAVALFSGDRNMKFTAGTGREPLRFAEIVQRAAAGETRARRTLEQTGEYLGIGIANVIGGLGVTRVVVSGRIVLGWGFIEGALHEALRRTMAGRLSEWTVVAGEPIGAGLGGALEVAIDRYLLNVEAGI